MKKITSLLILFLLLLSLFTGLVPNNTVNAFITCPGVYYGVGYTNYTTGSCLDFSVVDVELTYIKFNGTTFYTTATPATTHVNITLNYLHPHPDTNNTPGTLLLNYTAKTPVGLTPVHFVIGGFPIGYNYTIYKDTINEAASAADAHGNISYTNSSGTWDGFTHNYTIYLSTITAIDTRNPIRIRANWTTNTAINITWTKGTNTTNTRIIRKTGSYPTTITDGTLVYNSTGTSVNDTSKNPVIRYFYKAYGWSVTLGYSTGVKISFVETDNTSTTTSSSAIFKGWLATDKSIKTGFVYGTNTLLTASLSNATALETEYTTGDNDFKTVYVFSGSAYSWGETFRTGTQRYYLYNITIKSYRDGNPGMITASLYEANGTGLPSGTILSQGNRNSNEFTTDTNGLWYNFTMSSYRVKTNTMYCVMFSGGAVYNHFRIRVDTSTPTYTNGWAIQSIGGAITNQSTMDLMFKIWGHHPVSYAYGLYTTNETKTTTSSISISQGSLKSGQIYYYREHANDTKGNMTQGNLRYTLTNPDVPVYLYILPDFTNNSVKITWMKGNGANKTVIVRNNLNYPDIVSDGTTVYNSTGTSAWVTNISFNISCYFSLFSYTAWSGLSRYSSSIHVPWGGVTFIVYNESKPWQVINASIMVTDSLGLHPSQFNSIYGYYSFNITQIPYGTNTLFYISNSSYQSRLYPIDILQNIFYNFSFYLPPLHPPGWNTTPANNSAAYLIQIINEQQQPVQGASVKFYRYLNTTANYTYIGGFVTDGNGEGSISLFPYQLYMIKILAEGYQYATEAWSPNIQEQSLIKIFKIYYVTVVPPPSKIYGEHITFNGYIDRTTHILYVNYTDTLAQTLNAQIYIYEFNPVTNSSVLWASNLTTGISDVYLSFPGANNLYIYTVVLHHNHSAFGYNTQSFIIGPEIIHITTPSYTNQLWTANYGSNPLGWTNCLMWIIMVVLLFYGGREELPLVFIAIGVIFEVVNNVIGFFSWSTALAGTMIPFMFILSGILVAWYRYKG